MDIFDLVWIGASSAVLLIAGTSVVVLYLNGTVQAFGENQESNQILLNAMLVWTSVLLLLGCMLGKIVLFNTLLK